MAGTLLYCRSTVTGCSGWQGDLVMCFPPSTVAPGWATRESSVLSRALMRADVCTKLYVLITELRNCRSGKYIVGCDLFMCYNVDLCMY